MSLDVLGTVIAYLPYYYLQIMFAPLVLSASCLRGLFYIGDGRNIVSLLSAAIDADRRGQNQK